MRPAFRNLTVAMAALAWLFCTGVNAQQKDRYTVAIFLYPGVELLDFAGPGEVFSASGFNVYTVSADGNEVLSQGFVTIKPRYGLDNAPSPDVIIFPGGSASASSKDPKVMSWLKSNIDKGTTAMSVCTGAEILARAGLLEGYNVTTFHGFIPGLQALVPSAKVLADTRFVDNGNIITTAGVSAGIDGALHLVSRIKGIEAAKATAFYMEYDKWKPEDGRVDYKNENLERMKSTPLDKENKTLKGGMATDSPVPFEGEMKNLAAELRQQGKYPEALSVLESAKKLYPNSAGIYQELSLVYAKLGKPAPIDQNQFAKLIEDGKIDEAVALYDKTQQQYPGWIMFSEDQVNMLGYHLLAKEDYTNAVKVFQLIAKAYPKSANAFDSLGEGYMKAGNKKEAVANYKKSLAMDPTNNNAKEMLARLQ